MRKLWICLGLFLLIGCGVDTAVQDTSASLNTKGQQRIEVAVENVWTDMRPVANTNQTYALFRLEINKDAAKLGFDAPVTLYGGGTVRVDDGQFAFDSEKQQIGQGSGVLQTCTAGSTAADCLAYPGVSLTAQIDGLKVELEKVSLFGTVISSQAKEDTLEFPGMSVAESSGLSKVACYGRIIPDSNKAQIIMIGEVADGSPLGGGGVFELADVDLKSLPQDGTFTCTLNGEGSVAQVKEPRLPNGLKMEHIELEDLMLIFENGTSIRVNTVTGILLCC